MVTQAEKALLTRFEADDRLTQEAMSHSDARRSACEGE